MIKHRILLTLAPVGISLLASCYPLPDPQAPTQQPTTPAPTISSEEQQKIKEQRDRMREEAAQRKREEQTQTPPRDIPPPTPEPTTTPRSEYAFATPVPGKDGFVISPYNNKVIDVRGIRSGTLVQDPTYPPEQKKFFRVP